MKFMTFLLLGATLLFGDTKTPLPKDTTQLIVVRSENWQTAEATLDLYEKRGGKWRQSGDTIQIIIGKNGMGWGRGLHTVPANAAIVKKEGDGKAPAGIFVLKNGFGYEDFKIRYPYKVYTETTHCVDDMKSKRYNQIVESTKITKDYSSFEPMKFPKNYYKYGVVVDHNPSNIPGEGSCIFMHIKKPDHIPTVGCTSMSEEEMKGLLKWLDPKKHPLLIQAPNDVIGSLLPF